MTRPASPTLRRRHPPRGASEFPRKLAGRVASLPPTVMLPGGAAAGVVLVWLVADETLGRSVPFGVVAEGLVQGGLLSFTALGLVLVYRAARFVNFSQAAIGGISASLVELGMLGWHLPFLVALVVGLAGAAALGAVIDATVVRRLGSAPRLVVTVATIGLLQVLAVVNGYVPSLATHVGLATSFNTPLHLSLSITGILFTGNEVVAVAAVPLVLLAVWWFVERTETGTAVRGVADAPERAALLGIPVRRISRVVWVTAAVLSGLGMVLTSSIDHTPLGTPLTPEDLLPALAAFVLAGFESMPAAVAWSVVIGVVQNVIFWSEQNATYTYVVLFVLVAVGVGIRRRRAGRTDDGGLGQYVAARRTRPVPREVAALPEVRIGRRALVVLALAAAVGLPTLMSPSQLDLVTSMPVYAILGLSLVVLTGWAGQISLGQFAFGGVGAVVTGVLLVHAHADVFVSLFAAVLVCAGTACAIGVPALRLPGLALAAVTMAFAVAVSDWLLSSVYFPFLNPQHVLRPVLFGRFPTSLSSPVAFYELCLGLLLLSLLVVRNFRRSRAGRTVLAVRDNPAAASAYGISPVRAKLLAFAVSGGLAGLAGGLYLLQLGGLGTGGLTTTDSVTVFVMVVIGGITSPGGALLGAVTFEFLVFYLPPELQQLATGAGVLVFLLFLPEGLGGAVARGRDVLLGALSRRHQRSVPSTGVGGVPAVAAAPAMATAPAAMVGAGDPVVPATRPAAAAAAAAVAAAGPDPGVTASSADGRAVGALEVQRLDVAIGQTPIVSGVGLRVEPGRILALLGTNGAGKSTVLRAVAGSLPAGGGRITLDGRDITSLAVDQRVHRGVVLVPGGHGVFPSLTVGENLRLGTWVVRRRPGGAAAVADALGRVHRLFPRLEERRHIVAGNLSGGEQQMLAIAQGLLCDPRVLLIDELSLGLAPTVVAQLLTVVRRLADDGVAVVLVEQSLNVAAAAAPEAVFLERGRSRYAGPMAELLARGDLLRSVFMAPGRPGSASGAPVRGWGGTAEPDGTTRPGSAAGAGGGRLDAARPRPPPGPPAVSSAPVLPSTSAGSAFAARGIAKLFGGIAALSDVDLQVAPGEIVGLIGANGAGKTTLFDVCSGLVVPDRGRVLLGGVDVTGRSPASRAAHGLGRLFQDARLFPSLTVAETLATALEQRVPVRDPLLALCRTAAAAASESAVAAEVDDLVETMGLTPYRDRFVAELSTGTRRIVELACVTAHRPRVLLLDEPTAGLAQREVEAFVPRLLDLRDRTGAACVVIDHDMPALAACCDRLVCLHLGRVIASGRPAEVLGDPEVQAAYLGDDAVTVRRSDSLVL